MHQHWNHTLALTVLEFRPDLSLPATPLLTVLRLQTQCLSNPLSVTVKSQLCGKCQEEKKNGTEYAVKRVLVVYV